jgi:hypothetical protein
MMKKLFLSAAIAVSAIVMVSTSSVSAQTSFSEVLSGKNIPSTIRLKDLNPEWRGLSTSGQFEFGNTFQTIFSSFFGGTLNAGYYTKGQTVNIGTETYIVAYSLQDKPEKIGGETVLSLSLLNLKTIGSLNNIRVFNLKNESEILTKQLQGAAMFNPPATKPGEAPSTTPRKPRPRN